MWTAEFDLGGDIVLRTGGGGILGSRFARALARHGARVALVDRDADKVDGVAREISETHADRVRAYAVEITERDQLDRLRERVAKDFGEVTVLVNNAAAKSKNFFAPFDCFPIEDWDEVMRVNVTAVVSCCQVFGSRMAERGCGSIINIMSIYGVMAPDQRIYEGSMYEGRAINTPAV